MVPLLMTVPESLSNSLKTPQPPGNTSMIPSLFGAFPRTCPVVRSHCPVPLRAHRPRSTLVSRCGRARCPHRAAAPLPVAARHRGKWRGWASSTR